MILKTQIQGTLIHEAWTYWHLMTPDEEKYSRQFNEYRDTCTMMTKWESWPGLFAALETPCLETKVVFPRRRLQSDSQMLNSTEYESVNQ